MSDELNKDSELQEAATPSRNTVVKTIRLTQDIVDRLNVLCDHLGVTPGAYIVGEVGKAISRDEVALCAKQTTDKSSLLLEEFLRDMALEAAKDQLKANRAGRRRVKQ